MEIGTYSFGRRSNEIEVGSRKSEVGNKTSDFFVGANLPLLLHKNVDA